MLTDQDHVEQTQLPTRPERHARDTRVSLTVLLLGAAVMAGLLAYNLQPCSVAELGSRCTSWRTWDEYLVVNITGLLLVPMVCIMALPKEGPHLYGWWRPRSEAWRTAAILYAVMTVPLWVASRRPEFMAYYPLRPEAAYSWPLFVYHEMSYGLYMLSWEFFFRGFLTFGLARRFGQTASLLTQTLAFGVMHYGKPLPEMLGSFVAGYILGWLALRARSFYPGFALHWACSVTFDVLVILARPDGLW